VRVWPLETQNRVEMEPLVMLAVGAQGPKAFSWLAAMPGEFAGIFEQQVGSRLAQALLHQGAVTSLQAVRSGFGTTEQLVSGFDGVRLLEHLRDGRSWFFGHRLGNGDDSICPTHIAHLNASKMLLGPLLESLKVTHVSPQRLTGRIRSADLWRVPRFG